MAESAIRSLFLAGPAGRLEALLNSGAADARFAALVCHPHPLYGGTMHNKVVYHAMKALNIFGWPVLRFNFRGAGASEGEHDHGRGERDDVRSALAWLEQEFHLPIVFAGFSFGASVGLRVACTHPRVVALVSLGTPISAEGRQYGYGFLAECTLPKFFVSGERDQYANAQALRAVVESLPEPKELVLVPGADHFFEGKLPEMRAAIETWIGDEILGR
jgi:alpha/beta superfamily hydrolase